MTLHIWLLPIELIRNFIINAFKKKILIIIVSQFGGKGTLDSWNIVIIAS